MNPERGEGSVLDPGVLRELEALGADLGEDVLGEVARAFESTAPALVAEIARAFHAGDRVATARAAHTLRSASLQVGATRLHAVARGFALDASSDPGTLAAQVERCQSELAWVLGELSRLVRKGA